MRDTRTRQRQEWIWLALGLAVFAGVIFRDVMPADVVLLTTDDGIGELAYTKSTLPEAFSSRWIDRVLVGHGGHITVRWTTLLLWLLPLETFVDWIHALDLALASFFLVLFLRLKGRSWPASILAALAAFWVASNFTLTFAGHMSKFAVLLFAALALWCIEQAVQTRRWPWSVLAGGAVGAMFLEQPDVALFFGIFWGPYALFAAVRREGWVPAPLAQRLLPMAAMALLVGGVGVVGTYQVNVPNIVAMNEQNPEQRWAFATQWSWPPDETIDFIAPGYMGWRSGEPEGPYWGRMGRSAGWETGQGFRNFKLESQYLGAIPVLFAVWAVLMLWLRKEPEKEARAETLFWGSVTVVALLLAFGKYFPLYRLFYMLPGIDSIRNPNKFLQVFQVALAILAAYGVDAAFKTRLTDPAERARLRNAVIGVAVFGVLLAFWALAQRTSSVEIIRELSVAGWGEVSRTILDLRVRALFYGAACVLLTAGILAALFFSPWRANPRVRLALAVLVVAGSVADAFLLSRHYVKVMRTDLVESNVLTEFLKANLKHQRLALASQAGFYNHWLTYLFPYNDVRTFNVTQMPRMPEEYKTFIGRVGGDNFRLWSLSAVGHLMGPGGIWQQMNIDPRLQGKGELVYAFNVAQKGQGVVPVPATREQPGVHCVVRLTESVPRFALAGAWTVATDQQALDRLAAPEFEPLSRVHVSPDTAEGLAESGDGPVQGSVEVLGYRPGRAELQVSTDRPALLRAADKYDPFWRATVDDEEVPVRRCDYLFQCVEVPPGLHTVVLEYSTPKGSLLIQFAGYAVCLFAVGVLVVEARRKGEAEEGAAE